MVKEGFKILFLFLSIFIIMNIKQTTTLILEKVENLLLEGRLEDVKAKYPQPMWDQIDRLAAIDPSGNQKYLDWLAKHMLRKTIKWFNDNASSAGTWHGWNITQVPDTAEDPRWSSIRNLTREMQSLSNEDLLKVTDDIEYFHKNPSKYEKKDINQFGNLKELEDASNEAKLKLSRKEQKETGVDKVYEDDDFLILMPKTHKASCRYGSNTRWCVTMRGYTGYYENYFTQGPIFFLMDKRRLAPTSSMDTPNYYKIAMHYRPFRAGLSRGYNRALEKTRELSREEFINQGSVSNSVIDYWNVADENKPEKTVLKYLGGPGRGQTKKGTEALAKLKEVMEKYTKQALADYYDSLGDSSESLETIRQSKLKLSEIRDKRNTVDNKLDRVNTIYRSLTNYKERLEYNREEGDDDEYNWVVEQLEKSQKFSLSYRTKRDDMDQQLSELNEKIEKLGSDLSSKELVFYDPEKNVSIAR